MTEEFVAKIKKTLENEDLDEDSRVYYEGAINVVGCIQKVNGNEDMVWQCQKCEYLGSCMRTNAEFLAVCLAFVADSICKESTTDSRIDKIKNLLPNLDLEKKEKKEEKKSRIRPEENYFL